MMYLIKRADVATEELRSQLLEIERWRSSGMSAPHPQASDFAHSPCARDSSLLTISEARRRNYSPADKDVMLAQLQASAKACRDESRPPSERHAAKGALRDGLHLLEDCMRGRSPGRIPFAYHSGDESSDDAIAERMREAASMLSQLDAS